METLYHQTNKLLIDVQNKLSSYEQCRNESDAVGIERQIYSDVDNIYQNCDRLDLMVNKEPPSRKAKAKLKVDQIKYDCRHIQSAFQVLMNKKLQRQQEERDRELLMTRTYSTNEADTSIMIDAALQHNQRVQSSLNNLDELIYTGTNILSNLKEQGGFLKSVQKKVLDISNMLGLSNTVMRMIERRSSQDKVILFVGMFVTCAVIMFVYVYFL